MWQHRSFIAKVFSALVWACATPALAFNWGMSCDDKAALGKEFEVAPTPIERPSKSTLNDYGNLLGSRDPAYGLMHSIVQTAAAAANDKVPVIAAPGQAGGWLEVPYGALLRTETMNKGSAFGDAKRWVLCLDGKPALHYRSCGDERRCPKETFRAALLKKNGEEYFTHTFAWTVGDHKLSAEHHGYHQESGAFVVAQLLAENGQLHQLGVFYISKAAGANFVAEAKRSYASYEFEQDKARALDGAVK